MWIIILHNNKRKDCKVYRKLLHKYLSIKNNLKTIFLISLDPLIKAKTNNLNKKSPQLIKPSLKKQMDGIRAIGDYSNYRQRRARQYKHMKY